MQPRSTGRSFQNAKTKTPTKKLELFERYLSSLGAIVHGRWYHILGLDGLRALLSGDTPDTAEEVEEETWEAPEMQDLSALVDEIAAAGNGVVMTMGKGGVGKNDGGRRHPQSR